MGTWDTTVDKCVFCNLKLLFFLSYLSHVCVHSWLFIYWINVRCLVIALDLISYINEKDHCMCVSKIVRTLASD